MRSSLFLTSLSCATCAGAILFALPAAAQQVGGGAGASVSGTGGADAGAPSSDPSATTGTAGTAAAGTTATTPAAGADASGTAAADANGGTKPNPDPGYDVNGTAGARAVGMAPKGVNYGNFMDTRLSWTFGDDDFLHGTGELVPLSPTFSIGDRPQYRMFFDSLNSRFSGRENMTHLVMYKKMPSFIPRLTTEASLVLRFNLDALAANSNNVNSALYDAGSYIRIFYNTNTSREADGLSIVFFPLDTDRFRLGYLYDISWGGTASYINQSIFPRIQGSSPGLKIQYDTEKFYAFGGFKTATIVQPQQVLNPGGENDVETVRVGETNFGFLGGFGVDPLKNLRFDAGGGFFQQGKFDLEDVRGKSVYTYGGSARVVVHDHMPVPQSVDFKLYRNDPLAPQILFGSEKYDPHELAWSVSAEASLLQQHLKDFDAAGAVKNQSAYAGAAQAVLKAGYARVSLSGIYRNLNFVVRNVPGFIPFETLPKNAATDAELFGALAADYYLTALHLTPGIGAGLQMPATFRSEFTDGGVAASRTIVVRNQGDESILPYDKGRSPILQARLSVKWTLSDMLGLVVWGQFVRDNNGTLVVRDPTEGTASLRVFQDPNRLGLGFSAQARF